MVRICLLHRKGGEKWSTWMVKSVCGVKAFNRSGYRLEVLYVCIVVWIFKTYIWYKYLKTMLEVINLRTREHLSIPNVCEVPHLSKPKRNQTLGLQIWLLPFLDGYRSCTKMAQETPGQHRPRISIRTVSWEVVESGVTACKVCVLMLVARLLGFNGLNKHLDIIQTFLEKCCVRQWVKVLPVPPWWLA